jgi:hypothetical protein
LSAGRKLTPLEALTSTNVSAANCIDSAYNTHCTVKPNAVAAPWLALRFASQVAMRRVVVQFSGSQRGLVVRVADVLPSSAKTTFTGGKLLGPYPLTDQCFHHQENTEFSH